MNYINNDSQFDKGEPLGPEKWESSEGHTVRYLPGMVPHSPNFYILSDSKTGQYLSNMSTDDKGELQGIETHPDYRRQGLATELWEAAKNYSEATPGVPSPVHSRLRTRAGELWAKKTGDEVPARPVSGLLSPRQMNGMIDFKRTDEFPQLRLPAEG